jgi:predicted acetyltransferase
MIQLSRVETADRPALERLIDVYLAELSEHIEAPVGPTDAASYEYLPLYWKEVGRHPFFIVADGVRIGLVLIREVADESLTEMSEFYIQPESRRAGLGREALRAIWQRFPGRWRLVVHLQNVAAVIFWPRCIEEFATGRVHSREILREDGRLLEYSFEIPTTSNGRTGSAEV